MRHSKRRHILGVSGPHRSAMMGNLSVALLTHGRIETTISKAKALRPFIEKVITLAKKAEQANDAARKLHFRRLAISRVRDKKAVAKLFDELVSEFTDRTGGYTRIYKLGQRVGDAAEMALIELIDGSDEGYDKPKRKAAPAKAEAAAPATSADIEVETVEESTTEAPEAAEEPAAADEGATEEAAPTGESEETSEDSEKTN
ncbi:MAG: 50S ribosomal protein L17 [Puniceicoccaceae bacterium MED-G30]|nr:MAG: 50S ribosomal protein L17 [Puniceicoccaceae bacterium MED-G30]